MLLRIDRSKIERNKKDRQLKRRNIINNIITYIII